jgi:hypothetical protein
MRYGPPFEVARRRDGRRLGDQVVCSRTVKDPVAGAGFAFADRGTHSLKGFPDPWQLHAVELATC